MLEKSFEQNKIERILEPEIMSDKEQVLAYAKADFTDSVKPYTESFLKKFPTVKEILDIGCGTADVAVMIAQNRKESHITALDASTEMIKFSKERIKKYKNLENHISLVNKRLQEFEFENDFDSIISKDFLHHLENPMDLWNFIKKNAKEGTVIYIMDLIRTSSKEEARKIVEMVAGQADPVLKKDFYNSLLAAFTIDEVKKQLRDSGLDYLNISESETKRHFIVEGVFRTQLQKI